MKGPIQLEVEELEERIAPDSVNGVPGESNGNPGNGVSKWPQATAREQHRRLARQLIWLLDANRENNSRGLMSALAPVWLVYPPWGCGSYDRRLRWPPRQSVIKPWQSIR